MTGNEHQAQQVVTNIIVEGGVKIRHSHLLGLKLTSEFLVLAFEPRVPSEVVDRAMLGRSHEPGTRVVRHARLRPLLERGDQSILGKVLGQADIPHHAHQSGDEPRRLHPPDCVDRAM